MKYGAILADPPWAFLTYGKHHTTPHRGANDHYQTMTQDKLAILPIAEMAARDCALFMWVVDSHLDVGIDLMKTWGFGYKTIAFVWSKRTALGKPKIGMGYWSRKQCEICLLGTKGKPKVLSHAVRQLIEAQRREHSRKPDEVYDRIQQLVAGPYLELFSRQKRPGWDVEFSDQPDKFV